MVKLDKRIPKKEASKSSSKKSGKKKGMKRVPKKYSRPNLNKEKLSNKSLVNHQNHKNDLLVSNSVEESKRTSLCTEIKARTDNRHGKGNIRFTLNNVNAEEMEKQGVILEDQNEYDSDEESDDSNEDSDTVSSVKENHSISSINSEMELPPPPNSIVKKAASQNIAMSKYINSNENDIISNALSKLMNKEESKENKNPQDNSKHSYLAPLPPLNLTRERSTSNKEYKGAHKSGPGISKSSQEFFTDLDLLRKGDNEGKSKKVLSRLKMMI